MNEHVELPRIPIFEEELAERLAMYKANAEAAGFQLTAEQETVLRQGFIKTREFMDDSIVATIYGG